jgi:hypothetical protein
LGHFDERFSAAEIQRLVLSDQGPLQRENGRTALAVIPVRAEPEDVRV